jgi:nucleoside-diphosphate-sugar epimerase
VTQLGHVKDLSDAFVKVLGNKRAERQVFNVAGERFVTFDGIAKACAKAMGAPEPELVRRRCCHRRSTELLGLSWRVATAAGALGRLP